MKLFYLIVVVCGSFLILGSSLLPASRGIPIDRLLVSHSQDWQLKFTTLDSRLRGLPEDAGKASLLHFLRGVHKDSAANIAWATTSLSLVLLGILGWRREICFERKTKADPAPNCPQHSQLPASPEIQPVQNTIAKGKLPRLALLGIAGALLVLVASFVIRSLDDYSEKWSYGKAAPLNSAISASNVSKITALIDEDRTILRATGIKDTTPLNCAVQTGHREIVELLLTKGADINLPDDIGFTPLHCAAGRGDKPMVEFLLAKGASVNAKSHDGVTPLHMAVNSRRKDVVELLVVKGADLTAKSITPTFVGTSADDLYRFYTPLQWAKKTGQNEVADYLRTHGASE